MEPGKYCSKGGMFTQTILDVEGLLWYINTVLRWLNLLLLSEHHQQHQQHISKHQQHIEEKTFWTWYT